MSHSQNTKILKIHEAWARENGYRDKASSSKPQAEVTSSKLQA